MRSSSVALLSRAIALLSFALLSLATLPARAEEPLEKLFSQAASELSRGEYNAAIDHFESLADRGFAHPDASYDRGLAYVMRVRAKADHPGDLGRAAAAFEEALLQRPSDEDADHALDLVRAEVTRRRSRHLKETIDTRPTLDRMIAGLVSDSTWAALAITASIGLAIGLALRLKGGRRAHAAGTVIAPVCLVAGVLLALAANHARTLQAATRPGVVVSDVELFDDAGQRIAGDGVPEAASVEVGARRGDLIHVRWGAVEGWVSSPSVRVLAK
jgi:ElaB/YqjD/DUF883 family membrane-anchored ribosome-binding protein